MMDRMHPVDGHLVTRVETHFVYVLQLGVGTFMVNFNHDSPFTPCMLVKPCSTVPVTHP
jgi:hypothetical protein